MLNILSGKAYRRKLAAEQNGIHGATGKWSSAKQSNNSSRYCAHFYLISNEGKLKKKSNLDKHNINYPTQRALGLLLADGAPTEEWGKTFWRVGRFFFYFKQLVDILLQVRGAAPSHSLWWLGAFAYWGPVGERWKHHSHSQS